MFLKNLFLICFAAMSMQIFSQRVKSATVTGNLTVEGTISASILEFGDNTVQTIAYQNYTMTIDSSNIDDGDNLQILDAPGTGKVNILHRVHLYWEGTGGAFTNSGTDTTYIYTKHGTTNIKLAGILPLTFTTSTDDLTYTACNSSNSISLNKSIWINIADIYSASGNVGEAKLTVYYTTESY
jgi:hypothetical protein